MSNTLQTSFNEGQRAAILYCDGPSLVVAGAGSGKTRVLTHKIAYLIEQGFQPWTILALTFTNKAAGEMKARIATIVGEEQARRLWMGTFHSVFLRILRSELPLLPADDPLHTGHNFTIYDQADSRSLVKAIIREMQLDDKTYKPGSIQAKISDAKNHLISPEDYASAPGVFAADVRANIPAMRDIYARYQQRCHQADALDFDDMLVYTYQLFHRYPEILRKYQQRFQYILVDEYQDTNFAQHQIILQLAAMPPHRVCVVGDDAQSIYSFRGANIDNILTFQDIYPDTKVQLFKLEQNYRSTRTIVDAANSLIHKNVGQIQKTVFSEKEQGNKIPVIEAYSDVEEAQIIIKAIQKQHATEHTDYSQFAILYRTNAQSRVFEENMRKNSLPYRVYGGLSFYQRKEIKDVIAYFRMAVNPHDEEAFKRIVNTPARGIGQTTVNRITEAATSHQVSLWTALSNPAAYGLKVNSGTAAKLQAFATLVQTFIDKAQNEDANEAGRYIMQQSGLLTEIYSDTTPEGMSRQENVEELAGGLSDFCDTRREEGNENISLSDYLGEVALLSDVDTDDGDSTDRVTLMTIHAAKGLEFDTVFVAGLEENLFPNQMSSGSTREIEEERRLFYVAITRAQRRLYITYARSRFHFGKMEFSNPSRFIRDIDDCYLQFRGNASQSKPAYTPRVAAPLFDALPGRQRLTRISQATLPPSSHPSTMAAAKPAAAATSAPIAPGQRILHDRFGEGVVLKVEGSGDSLKATVQFSNAGTKQLLLKFARFKIIE